jgi:hypothetical protein
MRAEDHWNKAQRLENSRLTRLDPDEDCELTIWSCIHGGAQLLNVILHRAGVTDENFDMIHTSVPDLPRPVPDALKPVFAALGRIESLGPRFVRGGEPWGSEVRRQCLADYGVVKVAGRAALTSSTAEGVPHED